MKKNNTDSTFKSRRKKGSGEKKEEPTQRKVVVGIPTNTSGERKAIVINSEDKDKSVTKKAIVVNDDDGNTKHPKDRNVIGIDLDDHDHSSVSYSVRDERKYAKSLLNAAGIIPLTERQEFKDWWNRKRYHSFKINNVETVIKLEGITFKIGVYISEFSITPLTYTYGQELTYDGPKVPGVIWIIPVFLWDEGFEIGIPAIPMKIRNQKFTMSASIWASKISTDTTGWSDTPTEDFVNFIEEYGQLIERFRQ